jgi:ketol-acid reductoisomerase
LNNAYWQFPRELPARREVQRAHQIEQVGESLRSMMPWIAKNKIIDQSKN